MKQQSVLIVEDEEDLADLLKDYLVASEYDAHIISDGSLVEDHFDTHGADLILLDIQLPNKNGLDICKAIRTKSEVPIVFVTARIEEIDRLIGLEIGADDYICKPFSPREVVARVKTILRRVEKPATESDDESIITLNKDTLFLHIGDEQIELTKTESNLFELLFSAPGKIFSREQILEHIYSDYRVVSSRTVDSHIKKLRKKIAQAYPSEEIIVSIYGVGYKYEPPTQD